MNGSTPQLTQNLEAVFPDMHDELRQAIADEFPVKDDGSWSTFTVGDRMRRIISRTSNRIFVGLPLCRRVYPFYSMSQSNKDIRDAEWRDLQVSFTVTTVSDIMLTKVFPEFLKP